MEDLLKLLDNTENYDIVQLLIDCKSEADLLNIAYYILTGILDLIVYNIETDEEKKDYKEIEKIVEKLQQIKSKYKI